MPPPGVRGPRNGAATSNLIAPTKFERLLALVAASGVLVFLLAAGLATRFLYQVDASATSNDAILRTAEAAAYEMEINAIGMGLGTVKYLLTGDSLSRQRVEEDAEEFHAFAARLPDIPFDGRLREVAAKTSILFREFKAVSDSLIQDRDALAARGLAVGTLGPESHRRLNHFIRLRRDLDDLLDEGLQVTVQQAGDQHQRDMERMVTEQRLSLIALCLAFLLFALIGWRTIWQGVARPVAQLGDAAVRLSGGDLGVRVDIREPQELASLGSAFNSMAEARQAVELENRRARDELDERVRAQTADLVRANEALIAAHAEQRDIEERLRQSEKLEAVGRLAGGIAHDFNNLLTVIIGACDALAERPTVQGESQEDLQAIRDAADRAAQLTRQLLAYARRQVLTPRPLDLSQLVLDTSDMLRRLVGAHIRMVTDCPAGTGMILADPSQMTQVLLNLSANARDAMPNGGTLTIATARLALAEVLVADQFVLPPGSYVTLTVSDSGSGLSQEALDHLFEPFFTTKPIGTGTGLGLPMVYGIVKQSGGFISARAGAGAGTSFTLHFSAVDAPAERPNASRQTEAPAGRVGTILLVEDEPALLRVASRVLVAQGHRVLTAADASAAQALFQAHGHEIDLLVTDVVLPGMGGVELSRALRRDNPRLLLLFVSGYPNHAAPGGSDLGGDLLQKPFTGPDLIAKVGQVLA